MLILLSLGPPTAAGEDGDSAALVAEVLPAEGDLATEFTFIARGAAGEKGPSVLTNGDFDLQTAYWQTSTVEVGGATVIRGVDVPTPHAEIYVSRSTERGTVYLHQEVRLSGAPQYELSFAAYGQNAVLAVLMRERGYDLVKNNVTRASTDTSFERPLNASWSDFAFNWTPKYADSTHVRVYLRVRVEANVEARAGFDKAALRPLARVTWDFDGDNATDAMGTTVRHVFPTPGVRNGTVTHHRADGRRATAPITVAVVNRPPEFGLPPRAETSPEVPISLRLAGLRDPDGRTLLTNGDFTAGLTGWTLRATEVGGDAYAWVEDSAPPELRIVANSTRNGSIYVSQTVRLASLQPLTLRAEYRDEGPSVRHAWLLRERGPGISVDTTVSLPSAPDWSPVEYEWTPKLGNTTELTVFLRATVVTGTSTMLTFRNVSLAPAVNVTWRWSDGVTSYGRQFTRTFEALGRYDANVIATDAFAATTTQTATVDVVNQPPTFSVPSRATVAPGAPITLRVEEMRDPDESELIENGDFGAGVSPWSLGAKEIGGDASAFVDPGVPSALRIRANSTRDGTAYVSQLVPLGAAQPLLLRAEYEDAGLAVVHEWLLREQAPGVSRDVTIRLPRAADWTMMEYVWTPTLDNATSVTLFLRASVANGTSAELAYRNVSLVSAANVTWRWSDGETSFGTTVTRTFATPGEHDVTVTAADRLGASTSYTIPVSVALPLDLRVDGPRFATPGEAVVLRATPVGMQTNLLTSDFSDGWEMSAREVNGTASWTTVAMPQGTAARLRVGGTEKPGSAYLYQSVSVRPGETYRFEVDGRSSGAITSFAYILRERGYNETVEGAKGPTFDTNFLIPASSGGHSLSATWTPRYNSTHVAVYLRATLPAQTDATLEFRHVRFAAEPSPAEVNVTWRGPGCAPCDGESHTWRFEDPGIYTVNVSTAGVDGLGASRDITIFVAETSPWLARGIDGRLLVRWELPAGLDVPLAVIDDQGRREIIHADPIHRGAVEDAIARLAAPSKPTNWTLAVLGPTETMPLARFSPPFPASPFVDVAVSTQYPRPWSPARVVTRVADPDVIEVSVVLRDADNGSATIVGLQRFPGGTFAGEIPYEWAAFGRARTLELTALDAHGATAFLALDAPVYATLLENVAPSRPAVFGLVAFAAVSAAVAAWRRWGWSRA